MSANNKKDGNYIYINTQGCCETSFLQWSDWSERDGAVSVREEQSFLTGSPASLLLQLHQLLFPFAFSFLLLLIPLFLLKAWCATASSSRDSASISSRPNLKVRMHKQSCVVPTANPVLTGAASQNGKRWRIIWKQSRAFPLRHVTDSGSYRWSCRGFCPPAFIRIFSVINT